MQRRSAQPDRGVYLAVFHLPRRRRLRIGRLGVCDFAPGIYLYVGSAQRNLRARLARHARRRKPLHWHIDYLARHATMLGALTVVAPKSAECRLARALARRRGMAGAPPHAAGRGGGAGAGRFGCSDCDCPTHLFRLAAGYTA